MSFSQKEYIRDFNKQNYKMYQIRVRKDSDIIKYLDTMKNRNKYITSLIEKDKNVLTLSQIKKTIKPILNKYGITDINLFGSYARGEATKNSDVDIYCDAGKLKSLFEEVDLIEELEIALSKKVDIVFTDSDMHPFFKKCIMEDMIKLC